MPSPEKRRHETEYILDMVDQGKLTVDEGNVEIVRATRVRLITSRVPASVRKALNAAVKRGYLAHWKKTEHKPEVYFHPNFDFLARQERNEHARNIETALLGMIEGSKTGDYLEF